jgi:hypothetical protein
VSRDHHHKQQMTSCEPSSQVYLSRHMAKSLPPLRPRPSSFFFQSLSSRKRGDFPACKSRCTDRRGTGVPNTGSFLPPRLKGVSWSPIDPLLKQTPLQPTRRSVHLTMREQHDPNQPRLIDRPDAISNKEEINTQTPFPKPPSFFFASRKHKIANVPRPTPSK